MDWGTTQQTRVHHSHRLAHDFHHGAVFFFGILAPTVGILVWKKWVENGIFGCLNSDVSILSDEIDWNCTSCV